MELGTVSNTGLINHLGSIILDTSEIRVYYKSAPEVDCGNAVYRLHSGMQFQMRVFKTLEIE